MYFLTTLLAPKRLELMRTLLPQVEVVAALVNPDNPNAEDHIRDLQAAARTFGLQLLVLKLREVADFEPAFATLVQQKIGAVLVISDAFFVTNRLRLVDLAARNAIPTMYPWRDFADTGGLLSYGDSLNDAFRLSASMPAASSKATKPAICRFGCLPSSSSCSTSRPPRHSTSKYPRAYSPLPTR